MTEQAEIKNMRLLIVGGRPASIQVLRTAFGLLGLRHISYAAEGSRAIGALRAQQFSAIFCDAAVESYKNMPFPLAARRARGVLNPMTPLFLVYSTAYRRHVEDARDSGVTDVFTHPISASTIARKLALALLAPRPFIAAPSFFGPDRRVRRDGFWNGEERRKRVAKKAKVSLPELQHMNDIAFV